MIHPSAYIDPQAEVDETCSVGEGSKIWGHATLMRGSTVGVGTQIARYAHIDGGYIGSRCKIQNGVYIPPGVTVGDEVFIGPNACFTNHKRPRAVRARGDEFVPEKTLVRKGAVIGANATIGSGVTIGAGAVIAAGAVVTRDVPDGATVYGVTGPTITPNSWAVTRGRPWQEVKPEECGEL